MLKGVKGGELHESGDMLIKTFCHICEIKDIYTYLQKSNNEKYKFFLHNIHAEKKYGYFDKILEDNCIFLIKDKVPNNISSDNIDITDIYESSCKNLCPGEFFNKKNYTVNYVNYFDENNFMTYINNGTVKNIGKYDTKIEKFENGYTIKDILKYKFYFTMDDTSSINKKVDNNTTIQKEQKPKKKYNNVYVSTSNKNNENINEIKESIQEPTQESIKKITQKSINESNNNSGVFDNFYVDLNKATNKKKYIYNEIHPRINERPKFNKIHPKFKERYPDPDPDIKAGKRKNKTRKTHKNKKTKNTKRKHTKKYKN
jgi:hypothetical protein